MSNFSNYARLDAAAFAEWLAAEGLSRHKLEAAFEIPRKYWQRWVKGVRIAPATQRRLINEVGIPASVLVKEAARA